MGPIIDIVFLIPKVALQIDLELNATGVNVFLSFIHNPDHLIIDSGNLYGGAWNFHPTGWTGPNSDFRYESIALYKNDVKYLNEESSRCSDEERTDMEGCLMKYLEGELQCQERDWTKID